MPRDKFSSPTLQLEITPELHEKAKQSSSGGCLIADAIRKQYPQFSRIHVDMATIRVTDRKRGLRFTYLTSSAAQSVLLYFDQGWPNPLEQLTIRRAVKVNPILVEPGKAAKREARKVELEAKVDRGEQLTRHEKAALTTIKRTRPRPTKAGKVDVKVTSSSETGSAVVRGGRRLPVGEPHPNLLRGRHRHFGAKTADPGEVFKAAVDEAVAQKLADAATS